MKSTGVTLFYFKTKMSRNDGNADSTDMAEGHAFSDDGWYPLRRGLEQTWLMICSFVTGNKRREGKTVLLYLAVRQHTIL